MFDLADWILASGPLGGRLSLRSQVSFGNLRAKTLNTYLLLSSQALGACDKI